MMVRSTKQYPVTITSVSGHKVRAVVSTFGNVDFQGDRVMPGAFAKSINEWRASGDPVPFVWAHDWQNPLAFVGSVDPRNIRETPQGLVVEADLDEDNEFSAKVAKLLADRRVKEYSFAYDIVEERSGSDGANELHELKIIEVGPCLKGANPETGTLSRELLGVKATQAMLSQESNGHALSDRVNHWAQEHGAYRLRRGRGSSVSVVRA